MIRDQILWFVMKVTVFETINQAYHKRWKPSKRGKQGITFVIIEFWNGVVIGIIIVCFLCNLGLYVMRCAIWYHLYNLKNVKNTHGGVLILIKLQAKACNFTKINTPPRAFFTFFKLYKRYQTRNASHMIFYHIITIRSNQINWLFLDFLVVRCKFLHKKKLF